MEIDELGVLVAPPTADVIQRVGAQFPSWREFPDDRPDPVARRAVVIGQGGVRQDQGKEQDLAKAVNDDFAIKHGCSLRPVLQFWQTMEVVLERQPACVSRAS